MTDVVLHDEEGNDFDTIADEVHAAVLTGEIPATLPPPPPAAGQGLPRAVLIEVAVPPELVTDILVLYQGVEAAARVSLDRTRRILQRHALEAMKGRLQVNPEPILDNLAHQQRLEADELAKTQAWPDVAT